MDICQRTLKDHRLEFFNCHNGEERWLCLDCSEIIHHYNDTGCGG